MKSHLNTKIGCQEPFLARILWKTTEKNENKIPTKMNVLLLK